MRPYLDRGETPASVSIYRNKIGSWIICTARGATASSCPNFALSSRRPPGEENLIAAAAQRWRLDGAHQGAARLSFGELVMKTMKAYASFDDYLKDQNPKNQAIIRALRRFVKRIEPGAKRSGEMGKRVLGQQ